MFARLVAILALVGGANAGVCSTFSNAECQLMGCRIRNGVCSEPSECNLNREHGIRVRHTFENRAYGTGVVVLRAPLRPEVARLCDVDPICTAKYYVDLNRKWTSGGPNCNDYAMLPPHGVNQTTCLENEHWASYKDDLKNYQNYPFPNDGVQQSLARSQRTITALTADSENCWQNNNCAFPYGYYSDIITEKYSVCVTVGNAGGKWVEIMGQDRRETDSSYCVADMNTLDNNADKGCTNVGDLVDHRESGVEPGQNMSIRFYTEDNNDDKQIPLYWRVSASYEPSSNSDPGAGDEEKDAEDWSNFRDGAQYPFSLKDAYPIDYQEPVIFEATEESAAQWTAPALVTFVLSVICSVLIL